MPAQQPPKPTASTPVRPGSEAEYSQAESVSVQRADEVVAAADLRLAVETPSLPPVPEGQENVVIKEASTPAKILAELSQVGEPSDLVQIETSPEKSVISATESQDFEGSLRPRRIKPVQAPVDDEQLEQVETRK